MQSQQQQGTPSVVAVIETVQQRRIPEGVLTLQGTRSSTQQEPAAAAIAQEPRVTFDDSVVDNEHLGKKKSKICCIYRKPYDPNESSSDESSSGEEEDENKGNSYEVQPKYKKKHRHHHCSH